jgi:sterol desaturase/sphingolipid hydroxylase (fatty acid hydroxylase superfamily)
MIGVLVGMAYTNVGEWLLHKYVLHRLGRNPKSFWRYHWYHHGEARRNEMRDPLYEGSPWAWNAHGKEALSLAALAAAHLPLFPVAPGFTATVCYGALDYYRKHRRAHLDPAWARAHLPWHVDHHMGADPEANFCVTRPWFDRLAGTRVPGALLEREIPAVPEGLAPNVEGAHA